MGWCQTDRRTKMWVSSRTNTLRRHLPLPNLTTPSQAGPQISPSPSLSLLSSKQSATRNPAGASDLSAPSPSFHPPKPSPRLPSSTPPDESDGGLAGRGRGAPRPPRPRGGRRRGGRRLRPPLQGRRARPALRQQGRPLPQPQVRPRPSDPLSGLFVGAGRWGGIGVVGFVRCADSTCPISWSNVFGRGLRRFGQRRQVFRDLGGKTGNCNNNRVEPQLILLRTFS